jgi:hypothetical protein
VSPIGDTLRVFEQFAPGLLAEGQLVFEGAGVGKSWDAERLAVDDRGANPSSD